MTPRRWRIVRLSFVAALCTLTLSFLVSQFYFVTFWMGKASLHFTPTRIELLWLEKAHYTDYPPSPGSLSVWRMDISPVQPERRYAYFWGYRAGRRFWNVPQLTLASVVDMYCLDLPWWFLAALWAIAAASIGILRRAKPRPSGFPVLERPASGRPPPAATSRSPWQSPPAPPSSTDPP